MNLSNINWNLVWDTKFWFQIDRARIHASDYAFLYIGIALVTLAILALAYRKFSKNRFLANVAGRIAKIFLTIGLLEMLWFALRTQFVQMLGARFVAVLLLIWGLIWLYWPVRYLLKNYKEDMTKAQREANRDKYLNYKRK
jgi:protein-S-isoprenylcysteine O-methyltransferase Ste14